MNVSILKVLNFMQLMSWVSISNRFMKKRDKISEICGRNLKLFFLEI